MYDGTESVVREAIYPVEHKEVLDNHGVGAPGHYSSYRCAILFLLHERERYGHELAARLTDMGFDRRLVSHLDVVLGSMEHDELVVSREGLSDGIAPRRRVYALSRRGHQRLSDSVPFLIRRSDALGGLVGRYLAQRRAESRGDITWGINGQVEQGATAPW